MDNFTKKLVCVDENDFIIGTELAGYAHVSGALMLHRGFSLFLFNSDNKLLMQKRSISKFVFPGLWSNTVCSHPFLSRNSFLNPLRDAKTHLIARLEYELGITTIAPDELQFVTRLLYKAEGGKVEGRLIEGTPIEQKPVEFEASEQKKVDISTVQWGEYEIDYIFICKKEVKLNLNPSEVEQVAFVSREEYSEFVKFNKISPWKSLLWEFIDVFDLAGEYL